MIEFTGDAYESFDSLLAVLGQGDNAIGGPGIGFAVAVTPFDSDESFNAFIVGPVPEKWWNDDHPEVTNQTGDLLTRWPIVVRRMDPDGSQQKNEEIVIARRVVIL